MMLPSHALLSSPLGAAQLSHCLASAGVASQSPGRGIVAGAASGALCILATYPLDFVRTQLMAQEGTAVHSGILDVIKTTVQREGPLGLYVPPGGCCAVCGLMAWCVCTTLPHLSHTFASTPQLPRLGTDTGWHLALCRSQLWGV